MSTAANAASQASKAVEWQIDPVHSAAHFSVRHLMISNVRGEFTKLTGSARTDRADPTKSTVEAVIEAASINTREPQRDDHLRSADFLDVANHPQLTFRSKRITFLEPEHYTMTGDLTIRGVTKEVALDVEGPTPPIKDPYGNTRVGIAASTKINRKDFGLVWNAVVEVGGVMVGDEVKISIEAEFIQKAPGA